MRSLLFCRKRAQNMRSLAPPATPGRKRKGEPPSRSSAQSVGLPLNSNNQFFEWANSTTARESEKKSRNAQCHEFPITLCRHAARKCLRLAYLLTSLEEGKQRFGPPWRKLCIWPHLFHSNLDLSSLRFFWR